MTVRIWRIEHPRSGYGPYNHGDMTGDRLCRKHNSARWPTLDEEGVPIAWESDARFGFRRLRDLRAWFVRVDRRALRRAGYVLQVYRVSTPGVLAVGPKTGQVLFVPDAAVYVERRAVPVS